MMRRRVSSLPDNARRQDDGLIQRLAATNVLSPRWPCVASLGPARHPPRSVAACLSTWPGASSVGSVSGAAMMTQSIETILLTLLVLLTLAMMTDAASAQKASANRVRAYVSTGDAVSSASISAFPENGFVR
jgi:hypothetical protein